MSSQEQIAKSIAEKAHEGQLDKAGKPYIGHPARVANQAKGDDAKAAAWLHDVLEDTSVTEQDLRDAGISERVIGAVKALSHDDDADYFDYIRSLRSNALATEVKIADLTDNMDLSRLDVVTPRDERRTKKYVEAMRILKSGGDL